MKIKEIKPIFLDYPPTLLSTNNYKYTDTEVQEMFKKMVKITKEYNIHVLGMPKKGK